MLYNQHTVLRMVAEEEELLGEMPDDLYKSFHTTLPKEELTEMLRAIVRCTKKGIMDRVLETKGITTSGALIDNLHCMVDRLEKKDETMTLRHTVTLDLMELRRKLQKLEC